MGITLTNGPLTVSVKAILGWNTTRVSGNILHTVIGRGDRDVSLGRLGLRAGTLERLTESLADAVSVETYFETSGVHTLDDTERPEVGMTFVIEGAVTVTLDETTAVAATVDIGFQEVTL